MISVKAEDYAGRVMSIDRYLHVIQVDQLHKGITGIQSIDSSIKGMDTSIKSVGFARIKRNIAAIKARLEM